MAPLTTTAEAGLVAKSVSTARIARGSKLGGLAAKQALRGAGTRLSMVGRSERAREILTERAAIESAEQIVTVLGSMKGAAMKLGQMLSVLDLELIPDSHREDFRMKLAALRNQAPNTPFPSMQRVIEADLGPLSRAFAEFDETPVAAASIGQVYRARTHDGRDVAVKVQYPGIDDAVRADLRNLRLFAKLGKTIWPTLGTNALLDEIAQNLESELDYEREADTQRTVAQHYRDHPFIRIPDTISEYCSPRVLVTEYFDSPPFESIRKLPDSDRAHIGELIYRFYAGSLFCDNEFCGDPHPGNVLLSPDGKVGFIDFGLYNRMDADNVEFERRIFKAAGEQRADDLYHLMVGRGIVDPETGVEPQTCLEYIWSAAEWHFIDEELTITPEIATAALIVAIDPRSTSEFADVSRQCLPPEHAFSRRADFFTFGVLGQLCATNNWHRIAREWIYGEPPVTEIGREVAAWREAKACS